MTDKIKKEIERLRNIVTLSYSEEDSEYELSFKNGYETALNDVLKYINTLPEESISNDLEKAATTFADVHTYATRKVCFKAGAQWQKKQSIDKACRHYCDDICDCEIGMSGLCLHKYSTQGQMKNSFCYNECNNLKMFRKAMEESL